MQNDVLSMEEACALLGVGEKTMIRVLREEHLPARKIGREWRFSRTALLQWLAEGDSADYASTQPEEEFIVFDDVEADIDELLRSIDARVSTLGETGQISSILPQLEGEVPLPGRANLYVNYKQKKEYEKVQFEIYWKLRDRYAVHPRQNVERNAERTE